MANALTPLNPEWWSNRMGRLQKKTLVARAICSTREEAKLTDGDIVNRPYISDLSVNTYVKRTAVTIQDITSTNEQLAVDQSKESSFYVDDVDVIQNRYDVMAEQSDRATYQLNDGIDSFVFGKYGDIADSVDDGDIGGTNGNPITASTSNIQRVFTALKKKMREANISMTGDTFMVVSPEEAELIELYVAANGFNTADATIRNGYAGNFLGVKVYVSNNLTDTANVRHAIGGKLGAIDLVVQKQPSVQIKDVSDKLGKNFLVHTLYGAKIFNQGSKEIFDVQLSTA